MSKMHSTLSYSILASCSGLENNTFQRLWIVSIKLQPIKQYLFGYLYLFKTIGKLRWNIGTKNIIMNAFLKHL